MLLLLKKLPLSFKLNLVPKPRELALQGFKNFKFSRRTHLQTAQEEGVYQPLVYTVGYSTQTYCLLQFLMKPQLTLSLVQEMTEESGNLFKHHYLEVNLKKKTVNQYADSQCWFSQGSIYLTLFFFKLTLPHFHAVQ